MKDKVAILLATYNGENFIADLINSIATNNLDGVDLTIFVMDDDSTDDTLLIIRDVSSIYNNINVEFMESDLIGGSSCRNFARMIDAVSESHDYYFLSDQDDFWLPNKIKLFLNTFKAEEEKGQLPILVHSDLCLVDSYLFPTECSMFESQKIAKSSNLKSSLVQNNVTGCAAAFNKRLLQLIKYKGMADATMHDWYIGIVASAFGRSLYIDTCTVLYRQHSRNVIGAKRFNLLESLFKVVSFKNSEYFNNVEDSISQAETFLLNYSNNLNCKNKNKIETYIDSFQGNILARIRLFFLGYRKNGWFRNCMFITILLLYPLLKIKNKVLHD